jgi:hypothetical protein
MTAIPSRERDVGHRHERWGGERWTQAASSRMAVQGGSLGFREHRPARRRATRKRTAKPCGPGTRCWCQIVGGFVIPTGTDNTVNPAMTVTKRNSSPGRARRKPLKPLRRECRASGEPVVTTVCYLHYAHGLRVQRAPGISLRPFRGRCPCTNRARRAATSQSRARSTVENRIKDRNAFARCKSRRAQE